MRTLTNESRSGKDLTHKRVDQYDLWSEMVRSATIRKIPERIIGVRKRFGIRKGSKTRERFTEVQKDQVDDEKMKEDEDKKPKLKKIDLFY